jgi:hypothetical protein
MLSDFLAQLQPLLSRTTAPVILLEGTRQLPVEKRQALADVGRHLAESFSQAVFRSGNATGTDEAFAAGVATIPGAKLQLVLPTPGMGRSRRPASANCLALDDLPLEERHHLARESFAASPENHRLFDLYLRGQSGNAAYAKADLASIKRTVGVVSWGRLQSPAGTCSRGMNAGVWSYKRW